MQHHLVIIRPCYLDLLLAGRKRIECRLSKIRRPPFEAVETNDLLWLKLPSGPIRAVATVGRCRFHELRHDGDLARLIDRHADDIQAEPSFFAGAESWARYLSLISIERVVGVSPMRVFKSDQRAWVVLSSPPRPDAHIAEERRA